MGHGLGGGVEAGREGREEGEGRYRVTRRPQSSWRKGSARAR